MSSPVHAQSFMLLKPSRKRPIDPICTKQRAKLRWHNWLLLFFV